MGYFTLHRILAVVNISVLLVLFADSFLLPVTRVPEIYDRRYSIDTHGYRTRGYSTDYIKAVSGDEVQVPANWQYSNVGMNEGDSFYLYKSFLFNQSEALHFRWRGNVVRMNLTVLNNGYWGILLALYILAVSFIHLLLLTTIRNKNLNERLIFSGSAVLVVLVFFVFYH